MKKSFETGSRFNTYNNKSFYEKLEMKVYSFLKSPNSLRLETTFILF